MAKPSVVTLRRFKKDWLRCWLSSLGPVEIRSREIDSLTQAGAHSLGDYIWGCGVMAAAADLYNLSA